MQFYYCSNIVMILNKINAQIIQAVEILKILKPTHISFASLPPSRKIHG